MRNSITCLLLLFFLAGAKAQTQWSDVIYGESHVNSFNTRDVSRFNEAVASVDSRAAEAPQKAPGLLSSTWIDRISNMPPVLREFYDVYREKIQEVLNGGSNWLSDPTLGVFVNNWYGVEMVCYEGEDVEFTFPKDATKDVISEAAAAALDPIVKAQWEVINNFMLYLSMSVSYDFPEGFWLDSYFRWGDRWSWSYRYNTVEGKGFIKYTHPIYFILQEEDFDHRRKEFQNGELPSAVREFDSKVNQVVGGCPTDSRYSQVAYFNRWLTMHNSYNSLYGHSDNVPTIAWSALSALRESTGEIGPVCEGYSKAFKIFCDRMDIPCMLVVGYAKNSINDNGESHMWNEVKMKDGKWYAVDVTWNDPIDMQNRQVSGYEHDFWLLLGKKDLVAQGFTFEQSHPNTLTWGVESSSRYMWDYTAESLITDYKYNSSFNEDEEIVEKVTIGNSLVAGYSSNNPVDFTSLSNKGVSAWIATGFRNGNVLLSRVYAIPAGEGVYVKADKAGTYEIPLSTEDTYYMNMFVGVPDGATVNQFEYVGSEKFLTLSLALSKTSGKPGFFPNTAAKTYGENKMYLHMPARLIPEYAKARMNDFLLGIEFEDEETTGISDAERLNKEQMNNKFGTWYSLDGRKIDGKPVKKGLYIVNGRKTLIP